MYRLVVIDDEYIVIEGIKAILARRNLNYKVVGFAYDGIQGLKTVIDKKPDLVITDIRIPGMDGLSLIEQAKELCPDTVFIVISGYAEFEYASKALKLGVRSYIEKPISIEKLEEAFSIVEKECFHVRRENLFLEKKRKDIEMMKELYDTSVLYMTKGGGNVSAFQKYALEAVEKMANIYPNIEEYVVELFKYLCVLSDIFVESHENVHRNDLVSYQEMEKKMSVDEMKVYAHKIIRDICKYMEFDKTGSKHIVILEILTYMDEYYYENTGLNEIADKVGMSTAYLSVLFKNEVGISFVKYLTNIRMANAKRLLREGYKVAEVSEKVGYSNYRYFCDIFKKHVGKTPNEFKHG